MGHLSEQRNDALVSDIWGGMLACRLVKGKDGEA